MKSITKKLISLLTAACICAAGAMPINASADGVLYGDVNGDSIVSLQDIVTFNKYLSGIIDITDFTAVDVNQNDIIDYIDRNLIQAYIMEAIDSLPY